MTARTFQAETMAEALGEVKRDLGRDAVILRTRSRRRGGLLGLLGGKAVWEIIACPAGAMTPAASRGRYVSDASGEARRALLVGNGPATAERAISPAEALGQLAAATAPPGHVQKTLAREVGELRRLVRSLVARRDGHTVDVPENVVELEEGLVEQGIEPRIVGELIRELRMDLTGRELADRQLVRNRMCEYVAARIHTAGDTYGSHAGGRGRVIALVGPTGVGKTTTIAKMAANYKLRLGLRVGLITIDTYRIAAVDQLQTYAEIIEVPLRTVLSPKELRQGVYALRGMDVVLIDTTGRSQNDLLRLSQMRSFLDVAETDEVHLVVSAATSLRCMRGVLEHFGTLGANRMLLTKLDEAATYGAALNLAEAGIGPIGYVTTGQEVPDDIAPADSMSLAKRIMGGINHA
ncbi:MAG: flagellar biosynthesis protein FlhF [Phycisphaerae bacterium]|nr:flagellar biosynthesis protein FlhF [Phycisphaerae bacterium]